MATASAFPILSVPEDTMEMSSPALHDDGDIDLDFDDGDFGDGGVQLQEDEQMLTDGEQTRPPTATDAEMMEDMPIESHAEETDMQDTPEMHEPFAEQDDEELIDYGEDPEDTTLVKADEGFNNTLPEQQPAGDGDQVGEDVGRQPEDFAHETDHFSAFTEFMAQPEGVDASLDPADEAGFLPPHDGFSAEVQPIQPANDTQATAIEDNAKLAEEQPEQLYSASEAAHADEDVAVQPALTLDTGVHEAVEQPGTPTDTGLHPMTVYYGELAMPLFKSKHQPDGLLKDDNLASISLHELLRHCRERLAHKIGNVPEDQELTLAFDHMGLTLVENSRAAFEHSLNDILEVYLRLHQNDGNSEIPALSLSLSHQQFSNQLSVLKQASEQGSGMSHFLASSEEAHEYYDDDGRDEPGVIGEDDAEHAQTEDQHHEEEQNPENGEYDTHAAEQAAQEYDDTAARSEQHRQEEEYEGQEYEEGAEQPYDEQADGEHDAQQYTDGSNASAGDAEVDQVDQQSAVTQDQPALGDGPHEDADNLASSASSQTVQGDIPADSSTEVPTDHHDDFSTLLTEYEGDGGKPAEAQQDNVGGEDDSLGAVQSTAFDDGSLQQEAQPYDGEPPLILGSEDFLDENADADNGVQHGDEEAQDYHGHQEEYQDQADTFDEQQEDTYQEPGDDEGQQEESYNQARDALEQHGEPYQHLGEDVQSHTAHDIVDGEGHQDELDQEPSGEDYTGEELAPTNGETEYQEDGLDDLVDFGDEIGFDDDTTAEHEARRASQPDIPAVGQGSPLGKRSFEEHADDELDFDEPDLKKVRSG